MDSGVGVCDGDGDIGDLIKFQQEELMAARAIMSDFDYACQLQMKEAITSSLLQQPSTSSSHTPPRSHLLSESVPSSLALDLQEAEITRCQQELRDSALSREELRKVSKTLRIRKHDEKFAREIERMDDDEWDHRGDNFEKPVAEGGGDLGVYKVFVKGISCGSTGLAAVGVAVLDSVGEPGELLLNLQKPIVGEKVGREAIEALALIEGLTAVVALGIQRVEVFVDNMVLYNHITRRWAAKHRKIAMLVENAWSLQRKIERCTMGLLPRCKMPFVFQLARGAIDSQMKSAIEVKGKGYMKETCSICSDDVDVARMHMVDVCMHRYCISCMKQHVEVKLLHGILPPCPHVGCKSLLSLESSKSFLAPKFVYMMSQHIKEASIPTAEKVYCPDPKCSALMSRHEVNFITASSSRHPAGLRKCIKCNGSFCINCKVPWNVHVNMTCQEYQRSHPNPLPGEAQLKNLAKKAKWRQCEKCNRMIELAEGCYHMTCRCGYEFCYTCGGPWINKKATCSCPLWNEAQIIYDRNNHVYLEESDVDIDEHDDEESVWDYENEMDDMNYGF